MPRQPHPLPPVLPSAFSYAAARAAGVSEGRLRTRDLERPFYGVRRLSEPAVEPQGEEEPGGPDRRLVARVRRDAEAYAVTMSPLAFFAGRTALLLHGATALGGDELLEVAVPAPQRCPRGAGVRGRKIRRDFAVVHDVDGLRVASPASAWAMLAMSVTAADLVRSGDELVRIPRDESGHRRPEISVARVDDLRATAAVVGRPGRATLLSALDQVRTGSMSPLETDFRLVVCAAGLPEPELDVELRDDRGRLLGIADAAYRTSRVLIEVEGDHHRTSARQWQRDIEKHTAFVAAGWEVVRLTAAHIRGRDREAVRIVAGALRRRGWRPEA